MRYQIIAFLKRAAQPPFLKIIYIWDEILYICFCYENFKKNNVFSIYLKRLLHITVHGNKISNAISLATRIRHRWTKWWTVQQFWKVYTKEGETLLLLLIVDCWVDNTLVKLLEELHPLIILLLVRSSVTATDEDLLLDCSGNTKLLDDEELPSTAAA